MPTPSAAFSPTRRAMAKKTVSRGPYMTSSATACAGRSDHGTSAATDRAPSPPPSPALVA